MPLNLIRIRLSRIPENICDKDMDIQAGKKIDVIIPVYKPTERILSLFLMLSKQTVKPSKVVVINTEEEYWNDFFGDFDILAKYPFIELHHITKNSFDHGRTRNLGVSHSDEEFFLMMTDDAIPDDEFLIENLLKNFEDAKVGMVYARQIPHKGCRAIEKYTRAFNYPLNRTVKGAKDIPTLGIKAFYASNVCCMYRKSIFAEMGGFIQRTIFNEDMIYARRMIDKGYLIVYEPSAQVRHSHNYSGIQYLKRNFDLGVSHADNPEIFGDVKAEGEGKRLVMSTAKFLCKKFMPWMVVVLVYHSGCKYIGYRLGCGYRKLSKKTILKFTMSPGYFS